jgi:hypothetical protein
VALLTKVTIGYDTLASGTCHAGAGRAALHRLNQDEALVRQLHLQDWYVEYELQVRMKASELPAVVKTELHGHIQDVFNEFGVQIASPTRCPAGTGCAGGREQWYQAPARAPVPPSPARE